MEALNVYHQYGEELERGLRLASLPLAIKLLKTEEDIPEEAQRPIRDMGHHLSLCQVFQMSRVSAKSTSALSIISKDLSRLTMTVLSSSMDFFDLM